MNAKRLIGGTAHDVVSNDLQHALRSRPEAMKAWDLITPLARNEWICWVESAKKQETRVTRIERAAAELADGVKRPCCWIGCIHRTDKAISPSVQWVLDRQNASKK